jgi:hypothetical protein
MKKIIKKKCNSRPMIKLDSNLNTMFFLYSSFNQNKKRKKSRRRTMCLLRFPPPFKWLKNFSRVYVAKNFFF